MRQLTNLSENAIPTILDAFFYNVIGKYRETAPAVKKGDDENEGPHDVAALYEEDPFSDDLSKGKKVPAPDYNFFKSVRPDQYYRAKRYISHTEAGTGADAGGEKGENPAASGQLFKNHGELEEMLWGGCPEMWAFQQGQGAAAVPVKKEEGAGQARTSPEIKEKAVNLVLLGLDANKLENGPNAPPTARELGEASSSRCGSSRNQIQNATAELLKQPVFPLGKEAYSGSILRDQTGWMGFMAGLSENGFPPPLPGTDPLLHSLYCAVESKWARTGHSQRLIHNPGSTLGRQCYDKMEFHHHHRESSKAAKEGLSDDHALHGFLVDQLQHGYDFLRGMRLERSRTTKNAASQVNKNLKASEQGEYGSLPDKIHIRFRDKISASLQRASLQAVELDRHWGGLIEAGKRHEGWTPKKISENMEKIEPVVPFVPESLPTTRSGLGETNKFYRARKMYERKTKSK